MTRKTIDLESIRRAHARLDAYLERHPGALGGKTEMEWLETVREVLMEKTVFSVKDAAALLDVSEETIRRAIRNKKLKAGKLGGKDLRISKHDLAEFYRQQGGGSLFGDEPEEQ